MLFIPPIIINTIPAIVAAISKVATTIGPMIAKYAPILLETLGKNLPRAIQTIEEVSLVANVLRPNEHVEDLGAKAMAADKAPEDFTRINDYIDYLRNEVEVDSQALSQDPLDSTIRNAIGATIALKGVGEMMGSEILIAILKTISQLGLEPKLILTIVKAYAQSGLNTDDVELYLNDQLTIAQSQQHSEVLVTAFQVAEPELDRQQAEDAVMNLR